MNTVAFPAAPFSLSKKKSPANRANFLIIRATDKKNYGVGETLTNDLNFIRKSLIKQEDTIIYSILERAEYPFNDTTYNPKSRIDQQGSVLQVFVKETEKVRARFGRYQSEEENPFLLDNPSGSPLLWLSHYPKVLHPCASAININSQIWDFYLKDLLPKMVKPGSDSLNIVSTAICDYSCLQALSRRIHFGKFVAEAKFTASPAEYEAAIKAKDAEKLMELLTYPDVERAVLKRVVNKAMMFGRILKNQEEDDGSQPLYKVDPAFVGELYGEWIMPLTKKVEVEYLLKRLD